MDPRLQPSPPMYPDANEKIPQELPNYRLQRKDRHTTSWSAPIDQTSFTNMDRARASTLSVAPSLPPKQKKQAQPSHKDLYKSQSLDYRSDRSVVTPQRQTEENPYILTEDIASFPENPRHRCYTTAATVQDDHEVRPPPITKGIRPRQNGPSSLQRINIHAANANPQASPTRLAAKSQNDLYTLPQKRDDNRHFRPVSPMTSVSSISPNTISPEIFSYTENKSHGSLKSHSIGSQDTAQYTSDLPPTPAIPHKKEITFVADFNRIQHRLFRLYKKVEESQEDSTMMVELKAHLRLSEHDATENVLERLHMSLAPPLEEEDLAQKMMYVVDFRSFRDKFDLRHRIIEMFAKPGPPSISYAKVDAKMDSIITEFCARVANLRDAQGKLIESPAHARISLQGVSEGEQLVKALRENQLWIRWGTVSNLPPLYHLYMHKHPPSYEVRKAVTISFIAERLKAMPHMMNKVMDPHVLCPPIYSRLKCDNGKTKWQVTEYNSSSGKFDTHECQFPSWLDDESTAISLLRSSNRTPFALGNHPYALYSVYVVIIKDFSLAQEGATRSSEKESSWAAASKVQYYIGSSSTGVLYRFAHVENSHCERTLRVLSEAPALRHFRCYEGCDLVEACLALAWARRQPRAVVVLNSFLPSNMSSLSLEQKAPYRDKMMSLASHLTEGKKIGPLCDMRFGMNGTTTIQSDEE